MPTFQSPAAAILGQYYSATVVQTAESPAAPGDYRAIGYAKNAAGSWTAGPQRTADYEVPPVTAHAADNYYLYLGAGAAPATHAPGSTVRGFYLDVTSGQVVYGTLTSSSTAAAGRTIGGHPTVMSEFTPGRPATADDAPRYTWTIDFANSAHAPGGAERDAAARPGAPAVQEGHVYSPQFTLPVLFEDVPATAPFASDIYTLSRHGVANGYANGTFGPTRAVSREAFIAFAARLLTLLPGTPDVATGPCTTTEPSAFVDVAADSPFCASIRTLAHDGVVHGYPGDAFHPAAPITREAIAAFLYRLNDLATNSAVADAPTTRTSFTDVSANSPFSGDIAWLFGRGITKGFADGGFHPTSETTREAVAAFFVRWAKQYPGDPLS